MPLPSGISLIVTRVDRVDVLVLRGADHPVDRRLRRDPGQLVQIIASESDGAAVVIHTEGVPESGADPFDMCRVPLIHAGHGSSVDRAPVRFDGCRNPRLAETRRGPAHITTWGDARRCYGAPLPATSRARSRCAGGPLGVVDANLAVTIEEWQGWFPNYPQECGPNQQRDAYLSRTAERHRVRLPWPTLNYAGPPAHVIETIIAPTNVRARSSDKHIVLIHWRGQLNHPAEPEISPANVRKGHPSPIPQRNHVGDESKAVQPALESKLSDRNATISNAAATENTILATAHAFEALSNTALLRTSTPEQPRTFGVSPLTPGFACNFKPRKAMCP